MQKSFCAFVLQWNFKWKHSLQNSLANTIITLYALFFFVCLGLKDKQFYFSVCSWFALHRCFLLFFFHSNSFCMLFPCSMRHYIGVKYWFSFLYCHRKQKKKRKSNEMQICRTGKMLLSMNALPLKLLFGFMPNMKLQILEKKKQMIASKWFYIWK